MSMTGKSERVEVITSVERRRRWTAEEKAAIVQETPAFAGAGAVGAGEPGRSQSLHSTAAVTNGERGG